MGSVSVKPNWQQPSHPDIQRVEYGRSDTGEFLTKSFSKVFLDPGEVLALIEFPPCEMVRDPSYASVQCGRNKHLLLNSDLMYINHSCDPTLEFNLSSFHENSLSQTVPSENQRPRYAGVICAGPNGLKRGEELTFFYPSTEWEMAQPFDCNCASPRCRKKISGAKDMTPEQLGSNMLNPWIKEMKAEQRKQSDEKLADVANGKHTP